MEVSKKLEDEFDSDGNPKESESAEPDHEVIRGRVGIIMPARGAFDFVDRP